jgi:SAM-dependent methyltransferase
MPGNDVLNAIQGFYLSHILLYFRQQELFECFRDPVAPSEIAIARGYDVGLFSALVEFVHLCTKILHRDHEGRYRLHDNYRSFYWLGFQIDKFIGAYGPTVANLGFSLTQQDLGRGLVDRGIEAAAYGVIQSPPNPLVVEEIKKRKICSLVDIGCGPGTLLKMLAEADIRFRGWGIDADAEMLEVAREILAASDISDRVQLIQADARALRNAIPSEARETAQAVHCKGLFNELFRKGDAAVVNFLSDLRQSFPSAILFNVDYYGKLTNLSKVPARYQHTLLHDLLQQLTAQGTPPANLNHWVDIYDAAGCSVLHVYESESSGIDWFVHVVQH